MDDIGGIVARIFASPNAFLGRAMEIAGDQLTPRQIVAAMSEVLNAPVRFVRLPIEVVRSFNEDVALISMWLAERGYEADMAAVRTLYPMTRFDSWLGLTGWINRGMFAASAHDGAASKEQVA